MPQARRFGMPRFHRAEASLRRHVAGLCHESKIHDSTRTREAGANHASLLHG